MQTGLNFDVVDAAFYDIAWKRFLFLLSTGGERGHIFFKNTTHIITEFFFCYYYFPFLYFITHCPFTRLQSAFAFLVAIILARPANTNVHQKEKKTNKTFAAVLSLNLL